MNIKISVLVPRAGSLLGKEADAVQRLSSRGQLGGRETRRMQGAKAK